MHQFQTRLSHSLLIGSALLFVLSALMACGMSTPPATLPVPTVGATASQETPEIPWFYSIKDPTKRAYFVHGYEQTIADMTEVALTPRPPRPTPYFIQGTIAPGIPAGAGTRTANVPGSFTQAPFQSSLFLSKNHWDEPLTDYRLEVYAGVQGSSGDPQQGEIIVFRRSLNYLEFIPPFDFYITPSKVGPVTITDAVGERLTLQADDGTTFYFDLPTRQWVNP